mmetsp:Transcript_20317/g.46910  ORF Transcript_20317/g.46910 Transcript_20317/m.46910 type:complete len:244 (+) Transcript_20317:910-1641(+)
MGALVADLLAPSRGGDEHLLLRLDGDCVQAGLLLLDVLRDARDGAAGADARDEHVDLPVGVPPDFGASGLAVDLCVRRILKLLQHVAVAVEAVHDLVRLGERAGHRRLLRREHHLAAERHQHHAPLDRHRLWHRKDAAVAALARDEGQGDARVARGGLYQHRLPGGDRSRLLRLVDHRTAQPVLDRRARPERLELRGDAALDALRHLVDVHQRRVPDEVARTRDDVDRATRDDPSSARDGEHG